MRRSAVRAPPGEAPWPIDQHEGLVRRLLQTYRSALRQTVVGRSEGEGRQRRQQEEVNIARQIEVIGHHHGKLALPQHLQEFGGVARDRLKVADGFSARKAAISSGTTREQSVTMQPISISRTISDDKARPAASTRDA
jgi:hypothetical protein